MISHPLKRWMILNDLSSTDLEKTSGVNASTIRHICRYKTASAVKMAALSDATGIPPLVLIRPKEHCVFDVSVCKPIMRVLSNKMPVV